jgi:hypothetical protein
MKLRIYLIADCRTKKIESLYKDRVEFVVERIPKGAPWVAYKDNWRLPERSWIDAHTARVYAEEGKNVDGVMFVLSDWENGSHRINGLQPSFLSNTYETMFVKGDSEGTAFHEIKHLLDNLSRTHLRLKLETVMGITDWDDDVFHHPAHKHDFEYQLEYVWPYVEECIRIRRMYMQLTAIGKMMADISILINSLILRNTKERAIHETA